MAGTGYHPEGHRFERLENHVIPPEAITAAAVRILERASMARAWQPGEAEQFAQSVLEEALGLCARYGDWPGTYAWICRNCAEVVIDLADASGECIDDC